MALTKGDLNQVAELVAKMLAGMAQKPVEAPKPVPAIVAQGAPKPAAYIPRESGRVREITSRMVYSVISFVKAYPVATLRAHTKNSSMLDGLAKVEVALEKSPIDRARETGAQWAARMLPGISPDDFGHLCAFVKNGRKLAADGQLPGLPVVKSGLHRAELARW